MATRGKAINVKIATAKVIQALETKLAQIEADYSKQDEKEANFKLAQGNWRMGYGTLF